MTTKLYRFTKKEPKNRYNPIFGFYEFFAGGGMVRAALNDRWNCLFANDFDHRKGQTYRINWGDKELKTADVRELSTSDLPGQAQLVWASFPCQDLSLAGAGAGLKGERSGTFWPFWNLMKSMISEGREPEIIVLENVTGAITSHSGKDFAAICKAFTKLNYSVGTLVVDAALFLPQSRPRLFVIAVRPDVSIPAYLVDEGPDSIYYSKALKKAYNSLSEKEKKSWIWWNLGIPPRNGPKLIDIIEDKPQGVSWHTKEQTAELLNMMSEINLAKVEEVKKSKKKVVGTIYKRTRQDSTGRKIQRAEVRFDNIAGCLRTPAGGSSRQIILVIEENKIRSRLISPRETARLMGIPENYILPERYNESYHLVGDGVAVPVVRFLSEQIFEPLLKANLKTEETKAA